MANTAHNWNTNLAYLGCHRARLWERKLFQDVGLTESAVVGKDVRCYPGALVSEHWIIFEVARHMHALSP